MKKLFLLALAMVLVFNTNVKSQIKVNSNGNVGIGVNPSSQYKLDVKAYSGSGIRFQFPDNEGYEVLLDYHDEPAFHPSGHCTGYLGYSGYAWWESWVYKSYYYQHPSWHSDARLKKDINSITASDVDKLSKVNGVTFKFKEDILKDQVSKNVSSGKNDAKKKKENDILQYGFIAQEIIDLYPEIATYDTAKDMYFVKYTEFIPILVEGHKKQQSLIEEMQEEIEDLKKQIENADIPKLKSSQFVSNNDDINEPEKNILFQNSPNPFSQNTVIDYYLIEDSKNSMICVYDMNGTQLKSFTLHDKGYGSITINSGEFKAGIYIYTLIADGVEVDTKKMILTEE